MNSLFKNFLISMLFCLFIFVVLRVVFSTEEGEVKQYVEIFIVFFAIVLILSLIINIIFVTYKKYKVYKNSTRRLLVIGDEQCDQKQLLDMFEKPNAKNTMDASEELRPLEIQIVPSFLLTDQTPKGKLHLLQIRGSWFSRKSKLVVVINIRLLELMEEEQVRKYIFDISQVIKQLSFWKRKNEIAICLSQADAIEGCSNFIYCAVERSSFIKSNSSNKELLLKFGVQETFLSQIEMVKPVLLNSVTKFSAERFLNLLEFFHYSNVRLSQVDLVLDTFRQLQVTEDAKVLVF